MHNIPVIDLFAGPGGLSEGFSAYKGHAVNFDIRLSIEKDEFAHSTLLLRSFFRQFPSGQVPEEYYDYVRGTGLRREQLFSAYKSASDKAADVAWKAELGKIPFSEIFGRVKNSIGNSRHWVLLGGPPCQAYSVIGRARMRGMENFANDHRHTLYREYLKVLATFQPTVFVMENVKGILSSSHKESRIFSKILKDMRNPWDALSEEDRSTVPEEPSQKYKYHIYSCCKEVSWEEELNAGDYIIESEKFGIPQKRHRVILIGIRSDYDVMPQPLEPAGGPITVESVIGSLPSIRSRTSKHDIGFDNWLSELNGIISRGYIDEVEDVAVKEKIKDTLDVLQIFAGLGKQLTFGGAFIPGDYPPSNLAKWLHDPRMMGICQHESRSHMITDLYRYLFASCYAIEKKSSPKLELFPKMLLPKHLNAVVNDSGKIENFNDRFRVQLSDKPATTITAHISKDGHYFIHHDPSQCRSLTVREAARLQTFPDNYFFEGFRTSQFHQIGNAVPPLLAHQISEIVAEVVEFCIISEISPAVTG